jgi:hypothetical protein
MNLTPAPHLNKIRHDDLLLRIIRHCKQPVPRLIAYLHGAVSDHGAAGFAVDRTALSIVRHCRSYGTVAIVHIHPVPHIASAVSRAVHAGRLFYARRLP